MSRINDIRDYFITCPHLVLGSKININKIESKPVSYSIDAIGNPATLSEDILGVKTKRFDCYLTSTLRCDTITHEEANATFLQSVTAWVEEQNESKNFPDSEGEKIESINQPEPFSKDEAMTTGFYQLLIQYTYKEG